MIYRVHSARTPHTNGYVIMMAILIVSAAVVTLVSFFLFSSASSLEGARTFTRSLEAHMFAHACAERALFNIEQAESFSGGESISFTYGDCTVTVVNNSSTQSTVTSTGNADTAIRKIKVIATKEVVVTESATTSSITGIQWSEVSDF